MKIAVMGATGTAGARVVRRLEAEGATVVEVSRSRGFDLVSGTGLPGALAGVDVVVDASNAFPSDDSTNRGEALVTATHNVVDACVKQGVPRLVFLSIIGVETPAFDDFPYYVAKRKQEEVVDNADLDTTLVKTTQWHEFTTNPSAVTFHGDTVEVQDWLIQPVAVDTVADVLVREILHPSSGEVVRITGPEKIRLPELTGRRLGQEGDQRTVQSVQPPLELLANGGLLAPEEAEVVGPNVDTWLESLA